MLNFEKRTGPDFGAEAPEYPEPRMPEWYRDAKLGFFIHWGLYSVPAWAVAHGPDGVPAEDAYTYHQYAEWYGNTVRIAGSPTWERHQDLYGVGTSYEDLADLWKAERFDATALVDELIGAGARYVIPTTKHHEGFCLWDTASTGFNAVRRGPRRDLIQELHDATRAAGARFGVYYSGALDWHVSDFPAIESDTDLFRFRRNDKRFARYSADQLEELIARFSPDVLWNDIEWPDGGKDADEHSLARLFGRYYDSVPDGVVNDRWGVPYHGFLTREYSHVPGIMDQVWEATRGLGFSFGYNQAEDSRQSMSAAELVRLLVDVVSKNGNLLINVGPRADGSIPELQLDAMRGLGAWLAGNGHAIYATRPWVRAGDPGVAYTASGDVVHVHALDPALGEVRLPTELVGRSGSWSDGSTAVTDAGQTVSVPERLRGQPVAVLTLQP